MAKHFDWRISDEDLLDLRFCDLPLSVEAPFIAMHVERLYRELASRRMLFQPHVWLADEWFSADGVPGFAIPFYLAHPRLLRLERTLLHEAEGGNRNWMMRILRHEAGHAIDTAHRLRRRKDWREVFGYASLRYPTQYRPDAASQRHVQHLGSWYAQSHPTEDFAETFAVWLQPRSRWRRDYANWPHAMAKLEYIDALMHELATAKPKVRSREIVEPLSENTRTLREHYRRERRKYSIESTRRFDPMLRALFEPGDGISAERLLMRWRDDVLDELKLDKNVRSYVVYNVVRVLVERCRELRLTASAANMKRLGGFKRRAVQAMTAIVLDHVKIDSTHRRRQQYAL